MRMFIGPRASGGVVSNRLTPELRVRDFLLFHDVGAYGSSMSSTCNRCYFAASIVNDSGRWPE
jgi:diaminopimelate decarboxylase